MQPMDAVLDMPFEEAVERVIIGLEQEGFAILSDIDLQASLLNKMVAGCREYRILGAYNLDLAYQLIQSSPDNILLPVNVVLRQSDTGRVRVSLAANDAFAGGNHQANLGVQERLQRVCNTLRAAVAAGTDQQPAVRSRAGQPAGATDGPTASGAPGQASPAGEIASPEEVEKPNPMNPSPGGGAP